MHRVRRLTPAAVSTRAPMCVLCGRKLISPGVRGVRNRVADESKGCTLESHSCRVEQAKWRGRRALKRNCRLQMFPRCCGSQRSFCGQPSSYSVGADDSRQPAAKRNHLVGLRDARRSHSISTWVLRLRLARVHFFTAPRRPRLPNLALSRPCRGAVHDDLPLRRLVSGTFPLTARSAARSRP